MAAGQSRLTVAAAILGPSIRPGGVEKTDQVGDCAARGLMWWMCVLVGFWNPRVGGVWCSLRPAKIYLHGCWYVKFHPTGFLEFFLIADAFFLHGAVGSISAFCFCE